MPYVSGNFPHNECFTLNVSILMRGDFRRLEAFVVGGLGFEFCVFVAGWRHALRSEWPFIIIIIIITLKKLKGLLC